MTPHDRAIALAARLGDGPTLTIDRHALVQAVAGEVQAASNVALFDCRAKHGPPVLRVKKLHPDAQMPKRAHAGDAALDLYAVEDGFLPPAETVKISTGLAFEVPPGWFLKIEGRSKLASLGYFPTGGVVDSSYRGPVHVVMNNFTSESYEIHKGDRIAQAVILPVFQGAMEEVAELTPTERGDKGFGSTGR